MDTDDIKNIFKKYSFHFEFNDRRHRRGLIHPTRDWKIILFVFSITNIIVAVFSAYLFLQINKGEIFLVEPTQTISVDTIDREVLKEVLFLFEEKARNLKDLKRNRPTLVDPSL